MEPFNYSAQLQAPSFTDSLTKGFATGVAIKDKQLENQIEQQKIEQQQAAAQQQAAQQQQLQAFANNPNPTAADYASITRAFPQLSEGFKRSWDILEPAQKDAHWKQTAQVYAATMNDKPEVAAQLLDDHAAALENSGDAAKADQARQMSKLVSADPAYAKKMAFMSLYSEDAKKATDLASSFDSQAKNAAELPGQVADSQTKQVTAKYADSKALADLDKTGWDVKKIQADIGFQKESNRIAAMNAAANRESNGLKRQELQLKIQDTIEKRDQKIQDKAAEATSGIASIDNILNTLDSVKNHPGLSKAVGISSSFPTTPGSDAADFEAKIETLGSQSFLSQIAAFKGMGALSDSEGKKLQSALSNFSIKQSEPQLRKSLDEVERLMTNARANIAKRTGAPESISGGGLVLSSSKYGDLNESQVREFAKAKGLTRDQAIQVINSVK